MFIVKFDIGILEDHHQRDVFVTESEEKAIKYVEKANRILSILRGYSVEIQRSFSLSSTTFKVMEYNECFYTKIEVR